MNSIEAVQVDYINYGSRTLETVLLINHENKSKKVVYIYNYEGYHFRIFEDFFEVANFFNNKPYKVLKEYTNEKYADKFLEKFQFS